MTKKERELQEYLEALAQITEYVSEDYIYSLEHKQRNKGVVTECMTKKIEGDKRPHSNTGADLIQFGVRYELKSLGYGAKPSTSELVRLEHETCRQHAERIIAERYADIDLFAINFEDSYQVPLSDYVIVKPSTMIDIIESQQTPIGKKCRLNKKKEIIKVLANS